jgi:two-component system sensor histidine kinase UhpB
VRRGSVPRSLLWRLALANGAVLGLIFVLLLLSPVTVSAPIRLAEALVLVVGLGATLTISVLLIRRALAPLSSLAAQMENVDLRRPGALTVEDPVPELASFVSAFNEMLERLADERRAGTRAALTAQERERLRIARALHDEAGQSLTAVALEIERLATASPPEHRQRMDALAAQVHDSLDEIRRISRELRPEALDDLGLINALIALTSRVARQGGVRIERKLAGDLPELSDELELVIYRVAQEALTNVLRHAGAERAMVSLARAGDELELRVEDDGVGMPAEPEGETIGLEGMQERALLAGGRLSIGPARDGGTLVVLHVPVEVS